MDEGSVSAPASASASAGAPKPSPAQTSSARAPKRRKVAHEGGRSGPTAEQQRRGKWDGALSRLQAYREAHGHCNVPPSWKNEDGFALGEWVTKQRSEHKKYAKAPSSSSLTVERVEELERVGGAGWRPTWQPAGEEAQLVQALRHETRKLRDRVLELGADLR